MTWELLKESLEVLGVPEGATFSAVKERYRELARTLHPDAGGDPDDFRIRRVNAAYDVVSRYCTGFRFSFSEGEFLAQNPEELLRRRFMDDPIWGGS